jgi:hypothetical protein
VKEEARTIQSEVMDTPTPKPPTPITATVVIEGPAEQVLLDVQRLRMRTGKRSVHLDVHVSRRFYADNRHTIPYIKDGLTQPAFEKLDYMQRQTVVTEHTAQRLERLIKEFGRFTEG